MRHIVILGAGYGGLRAALDLDRLIFSYGGLRGAEVTLVDRSPFHELVAELHEVAVGRLSASRARVPLARLLSGRKLRLVTAEITAIDLPNRQVYAGGAAFAYDHLVVALGGVPADHGIAGLAEHALPLRTVADAVRIRGRLEHVLANARREVHQGERNRLLSIVVGGAGFTGIEVAGECADWLAHARRTWGLGPGVGSVDVVEATDRILPGFGHGLAATASDVLRAKGVRFRLGSAITSVEHDSVVVHGGQRIPASTLLYTGGIRAAPMAAMLGLPQGKAGRVLVDDYLHPAGHGDVTVIGDASARAPGSPEAARPPSAQLAIQHGRTAARNIVNQILGRPQVTSRPDAIGEVISLGRRQAVATIGGIELRGLAATLAKRAAAANYLRTLGGTALLDRIEWLGDPRFGTIGRGAAVSKR